MMNIDQLKQKLAEIDAPAMRNFILDLYLHYPELSDKIEALVLSDDPAALAKALGKRVQSLSRGSKFIDRRASLDFSRELEGLLADIASGLLASSPKHAFDLIDKFLKTADSVINRVDDSNGSVGQVYRDTVILWLTAAKAWQGANIDWLERVYELEQQNDYGVLDPLLPNANLLLSQDQLTQLAWRYESELRKASKSPEERGDFNYDALRSGVALQSIAQALRDPDLYERALLIRSPKPNHLQMKDICENYLRHQLPEAAMRYLDQPWESRFEPYRLELLDEVYVQMGDRQKLKQIRYQLFQNQQGYFSFKTYLEVLDGQEGEQAREEAIKQAELGENLMQNADLLLNLNQPERAQTLILSKHEELPASFHHSLLELALAFEKANCDLAATACYRALLIDILAQARSKAYRYGAQYYKKLEALAGKIKAFKPLSDHPAFVQELRSTHGLKRSFWVQV